MTTADQVNNVHRLEPKEATTADIFTHVSNNAKDLNDMELPAPEWIVPGILTEGLGMIAAAPKIGKSWFVYDLGIAVATGGKALGYIDVEQRPVLYFALEDTDRRLQTRLRALLPEGVEAPENLHLITKVMNLDQLIVLGQHFQDMYQEQAPLIIVDTLGRVSPGKQASQSQYEADYQTGAKLQELLAHRVSGCAVLVVHHTNKGEHDDFLDGISGTQGVAGAYDTALVLERKRQSDEGILKVTGRDIENETAYALRSTGGKWSLIGGSLEQSEAAVQQLKSKEKTANYGAIAHSVLNLVDGLGPGDSTSPQEISLKLGIDNQVVGNTLQRLVKGGQVKKVERGRYAPLIPHSLGSDESNELDESAGQPM